MTTDIDPRVARALDVLAPEITSDADALFAEVARAAQSTTRPSAGRRARRLWQVTVPLAAALAAVAVGPALGINIPFLDFGSAPKAPDHVVKDFDQLNTGAPPGMSAQAIADNTREVTTVKLPDGRHTLWVAPTKAGGMCAEWSNEFGGCDSLGMTPLTATYGGGSSAGGQNVVGGSINLKWAETVDVELVDGTTLHPTLAYVSEPINRAFFLVETPTAIRSVTAVDASGNAISTDYTSSAQRPVPSPDALVAKKSDAVTLSTSHGDAVIWRAPTAYGGNCVWLTYEGHPFDIRSCLPAGYSGNRFGLRTIQTGDSVLVAGVVDPASFKTVGLEFADGAHFDVTPSAEGFVLAQVPASHLADGHQLTRLTSPAAAGRAAVNATLPTSGCGSGITTSSDCD